MAQDIVVALMGVMAAAAVAACWWYEHHGREETHFNICRTEAV